MSNAPMSSEFLTMGQEITPEDEQKARMTVADHYRDTPNDTPGLVEEVHEILDMLGLLPGTETHVPPSEPWAF